MNPTPGSLWRLNTQRMELIVRVGTVIPHKRGTMVHYDYVGESKIPPCCLPLDRFRASFSEVVGDPAPRLNCPEYTL